MHEEEGCAELIAVDTFTQCTESLSLSALIVWTNQCLLGWMRLAGPQRRLSDEGTHSLSVNGPPTCTESEGTSNCMLRGQHTGCVPTLDVQDRSEFAERKLIFLSFKDI